MSLTPRRFSILLTVSAISLLQSVPSAVAQEPILAPKTPEWMSASTSSAPTSRTSSPAGASIGLIEVYAKSDHSVAPPASCLADCPAQDCFSAKIIPYGWLPGMNGDVTLRGITGHVDVTIGQTWDVMIRDMDFAALGQVEAFYGNLGVIFDGVYFKVSPGAQLKRITFSSGFKQTLLDFVAAYNMECVPSSLGLPEGSRFELLAGVRYYELAASLTITGNGPLGLTARGSGSKEWMDPLIGCRMRVPLGDCLTAQVRGDIGGFDLPQASRFSWNVEATMEYQWSQSLSLFGGWRLLDVDRERGTGRSQFGYDMLLSGPLAGLTIKF